jgi:hypothetical protein
MGGGIQLPALGLRPPEQPDALGSLSKLMAMKSMVNQQQLQQSQLQSQQQEQQLRQQQINDQQIVRDAFLKNNGDLDKTLTDAAKGGATPQTLQALQLHALDVKTKTLDLVSKQGVEAKRQADLMQGAHDAVAGVSEADRPAAWQKQLIGLHTQGVDVSQMPMQYPGDDQFKMLGAVVKGHSQQVEEAFKQAETQKNTAQAGEATASQALKQKEAAYYAANGGAPGVPPETVEMNDALRRGVIKSPSQWAGYKAQQTSQAEAPVRIATAKAEGQARQLVEGMSQPVYAIDGSGTKTLMSKTDALQSGMKVILPVTEKGVSDDIMLNNRLGDVRQKIARYEDALSTDISPKDRGNMAALLEQHGIKLGALGTEIPMDRLNMALQAENLKDLSDPARKQLISYRNAMEAMVGYQRVLSGSGRSSEQAMNLNIGTLPHPAITDKAYSAEALKQFKENLGVVGQGLPHIPGVKSPEEIENDVRNPQASSTTAQPKSAQGWGAQFGGVPH